jgi:hypothetical protein
MHITIVVVNVTLGVLAVALLTRSLRLRRLQREAAEADESEALASRL